MELDLASATVAAAGAAITSRCRRDPSHAVPSCPGWTVLDLTSHVGGIHRWAAGMLTGADLGPVATPPDGVDVANWADESRAALLDAMAGVDADTEVATFVGPRPARWWWRRQANETAVHAWDATADSDAAWTIPATIAADGLDEVLTVFLPRRWGHKAPAWGEGRTVHLHRTDGEGEWLVTIGSSPVVAHGHAKGDVAVRGEVGDLLLWTLGRQVGDQPRVEIFGDAGLADAWRANVRI